MDSENTFAGMTLQDLTKAVPSNEALIRVYKGQLSFNAAAGRLLRLGPGIKVAFQTDVTPGPAGTKRIYVGRRSVMGYLVAPVGRTFRVRSSELCRTLADNLQGYGSYRIEEEDPVRDFRGDVYYRLFFKKL